MNVSQRIPRQIDSARADAPPRAARSLRWWRWLPAVLPLGLLVGLALGLLVRWTVRDVFAPLAPIYYAAQPSVLGVAGVVAGVLLLRRRWNWLAGGALLLASLGLIEWVGRDFRVRPTDAPLPAEWRLLTWNVGRGLGGYDAIAERLARETPDLIVLVEANPANEVVAALRTRLPGYQCVDGGWGVVLCTRGTAEQVNLLRIHRGARVLAARIGLDGHTFQLLAVDLESNPLRSRGPSLNKVANFADERASLPLLVAGDFNAPPDSVHFARLRARLVNAFEAAGEGYAPTWPMPIPVLPLDQVWSSSDMIPQHCRILSSWLSDHRPVVVDFAWKHAGSTPP